MEEGEGRGVMRVAGCQEGGTPHMPGGTYLAGILQIMLRERGAGIKGETCLASCLIS